MQAYDIRDAADRLDELVRRVELGEQIEIERGGMIVARLAPAPAAASFDLARLDALAATLPFDPSDSVAEMRREARY
ncbi:type II toxin-antitoxin system Phd/YefM family antitoxin [Sphingomonas abaci]|uniref:Antitoxin (DNA-binding transcriptional repressor) of toxin-antitoxin stability system n=1 Tax=Sphingomonas abaci TaxID=237611 RepID=A0A7W7AJM8_9SPHN|nr:type II toxin-antitoxin system prevent-host-death family antitoxin [Sphingomonas abaci]MBB4618247.1 antitoxin (DNA-binding transcriptional repressor) of toxin-antitoxin stability system [Sphingomonas abaci]